MAYSTVYEALVGFLQTNGPTSCPAISWSGQGVPGGSPYYEEAPETIADGNNPFPYLWFTIPDSDPEHTFEYAYHEIYTPTFRVYMREQDIAAVGSQYVSSSPIYLLDSIRLNPRTLNITNCQCDSIRRQSYRLYKDSERGLDTGRVWIAEARYQLWYST